MRKFFKKAQYSKLIVSSVVLLYFLLIPYSLIYIWKFEESTVLITILTTLGGVVAVVCNGYMNKSRFENVLKIQKSLDKAASSKNAKEETSETLKEEINETLKEEIKNTLHDDITVTKMDDQ